MSDFGFVYMLHNPQMLCVKIGCTERSPHARADELSNSTGVPFPFQVACYVELRRFQAFERQMHEWLKDYRVNPAREFFTEDCVRYALSLMFHWPDKLSFALVDEVFILDTAGEPLQSLPDPWAKKNSQAFDPAKVADDAVALVESIEPF